MPRNSPPSPFKSRNKLSFSPPDNTVLRKLRSRTVHASTDNLASGQRNPHRKKQTENMVNANDNSQVSSNMDSPSVNTQDDQSGSHQQVNPIQPKDTSAQTVSAIQRTVGEDTIVPLISIHNSEDGNNSQGNGNVNIIESNSLRPTLIVPSVSRADLQVGNPSQGVISSLDVTFQSFWRHDPLAWFNMLEMHFMLRNITSDDVKYCNLLKNLGEELLRENADTFKFLPRANKYEFIKSSLISKYSETQEDKLLKLFGNISIGSKKPSTFFNEILFLAGDTIPRSTLITLWKQKLPIDIQLFVLNDGGLTSETALMQKADIIYESLKRSSTLQVSTLISDAQQQAGAETRVWSNSVRRSGSFHQKSDHVRGRSKSKNRNFFKARGRSEGRVINDQDQASNNHTNSQQKSATKPKTSFCYYHSTYGVKAYKCVEPCGWKPRKNHKSNFSNNNNSKNSKQTEQGKGDSRP